MKRTSYAGTALVAGSPAVLRRIVPWLRAHRIRVVLHGKAARRVGPLRRSGPRESE